MLVDCGHHESCAVTFSQDRNGKLMIMKDLMSSKHHISATAWGCGLLSHCRSSQYEKNRDAWMRCIEKRRKDVQDFMVTLDLDATRKKLSGTTHSARNPASPHAGAADLESCTQHSHSWLLCPLLASCQSLLICGSLWLLYLANYSSSCGIGHLDCLS